MASGPFMFGDEEDRRCPSLWPSVYSPPPGSEEPTRNRGERRSRSRPTWRPVGENEHLPDVASPHPDRAGSGKKGKKGKAEPERKKKPVKKFYVAKRVQKASPHGPSAVRKAKAKAKKNGGLGAELVVVSRSVKESMLGGRQFLVRASPPRASQGLTNGV